ncbi:hypothetical protein SppYZU01_26 [Shewanella phage SppYZU01]|nr:hypothetical protein SppYZU01_26 [Shewanella phage SppYZU01]
MAINPETQYPGKIAPSSADYPYGSARNVTVPGDGTGTPWEAAIVKDWMGFFQKILVEGGVVPSGAPDTVNASDYWNASFGRLATVVGASLVGTQQNETVQQALVSRAVRFDTVADMLAAVWLDSLADGAYVTTLSEALPVVAVWRVTSSDPGTGRVLQNTAGTSVAYLQLQEDQHTGPEAYGYDGTVGTSAAFISWAQAQARKFTGAFLLNAGAPTVLNAAGRSSYEGLEINGAVIQRRGYPSGKACIIPDVFPLKLPFGVRAVSTGLCDHDFDPNTYDIERTAPAPTYVYVDNINGDNLDTGLTPADPVRSINKGLDIINAGGPYANAVLLIRPGYYRDKDSWSGRSVQSNVSVKPWITSDDPRRGPVISATDNPTLSWSLESGAVWQTARSGAAWVVDTEQRNAQGDWHDLTKVNTLQDCRDNAGTWYTDNVDVYVHRVDGSTVTSPEVRVYTSRANGSAEDGAYTLYLEDIHFYGGTKAWKTDSRPNGTAETIVFNRCKTLYSSGNGFEHYGADLVISIDCVADYNLADGFNYHANRADLLQVTRSIEVNCRAKENGREWSPIIDVNNGSTAHEQHVIIRCGTIVTRNQGPQFADVGDAKSYNFNCSGSYCTRNGDTARKTDFLHSGSGGTGQGEMYLDLCDGHNSLYSLDITNGSAAYLEDCSFDLRIEGVEALQPIPR